MNNDQIRELYAEKVYEHIIANEELMLWYIKDMVENDSILLDMDTIKVALARIGVTV